MTESWVQRFITEERQRAAIGRRQSTALASQAEAARTRARHVLDALRAQVAADVEAFSREFRERAITFETGPLDGGFMVRRGHDPEVHLTVTPNVAAGTIWVEYILASGTGTLTPRPRELVVNGHHADALHFKDEEGQQAFRQMEQLSEYLLTPVFTGHLRKASTKPEPHERRGS